MKTLVVRVELPLDAARLLMGVAVQFQTATQMRLTGIVPQHTKKELEEQLENISLAGRELERGIANPEEIEVPDPAES